MQFSTDDEKPIFLKFAEDLEDGILKGIFEEETQIPSINEAAVKFKINPATANRGANLLVDEGIVYKKRGIGMFVSSGAREKIIAKRSRAFYSDYIVPLIEESRKLNLSRKEIIDMIERGDANEQD
jgi:DNA-binding transcriptional regulator YhcF (GntR family)